MITKVNSIHESKSENILEWKVQIADLLVGELALFIGFSG